MPCTCGESCSCGPACHCGNEDCSCETCKSLDFCPKPGKDCPASERDPGEVGVSDIEVSSSKDPAPDSENSSVTLDPAPTDVPTTCKGEGCLCTNANDCRCETCKSLDRCAKRGKDCACKPVSETDLIEAGVSKLEVSTSKDSASSSKKQSVILNPASTDVPATCKCEGCVCCKSARYCVAEDCDCNVFSSVLPKKSFDGNTTSFTINLNGSLISGSLQACQVMHVCKTSNFIIPCSTCGETFLWDHSKTVSRAAGVSEAEQQLVISTAPVPPTRISVECECDGCSCSISFHCGATICDNEECAGNPSKKVSNSDTLNQSSAKELNSSNGGITLGASEVCRVPRKEELSDAAQVCKGKSCPCTKDECKSKLRDGKCPLAFESSVDVESALSSSEKESTEGKEILGEGVLKLSEILMSSYEKFLTPEDLAKVHANVKELKLAPSMLSEREIMELVKRTVEETKKKIPALGLLAAMSQTVLKIERPVSECSAVLLEEQQKLSADKVSSPDKPDAVKDAESS